MTADNQITTGLNNLNVRHIALQVGGEHEGIETYDISIAKKVAEENLFNDP